MTIQIENYHTETNGNTVATFDIYLPNIQCRYRKLRLIRGKHGHFISFPSYGIDTESGKKYIPYVEYSPERQKELVRKVLDALKPFYLTETASTQDNLFKSLGDVPF